MKSTLFSTMLLLALITTTGISQEKQPLHPVEITASQTPEASLVGTETLRTHTDNRYGFQLQYPDDWTVKEAITEGTVFKAVKKFADGQYLMFTVNAQLLDRSDYTIDDISGFIENVSGGENGTVLDSSREQIGDVSCIRLLLDARRPSIHPRIEYATNVIRNRYLYTVNVSCSKSLYQQHAQQIKQLGDSFTFTALSSDGSSVSTAYKELLQKPRESWSMPFLIGFVQVFFLVLATSVLVGIGKCISAKSTENGKISEGRGTPNKTHNRFGNDPLQEDKSFSARADMPEPSFYDCSYCTAGGVIPDEDGKCTNCGHTLEKE